MTNTKVVVYEKPTCSKCRELKRVLNEKQIAFESINYFEQPLDAATLTRLLKSAGLKPMDAMRTKEPAYREHVAGRELTDEQMIALMVKHPELIQRPIVVKGGKAVLARPIDKLADLGL